jgi:hypothetical protein
MVPPPWELSRAADEAVTAYQAWCTGSVQECPVNLERALSRSRTYANPAAFDEYVLAVRGLESYFKMPCASTARGQLVTVSL